MKTQNKTQNRLQKFFLAITFVLLGLVAITATSKGQTPPSPILLPESLPVGSKGMIRAYAMEQVAGSRLTVFGESIMWSSNSETEAYYHPEEGSSIDEALLQMNLAVFSFKVTDKSKQLAAWAELHNSIGMTLFYGYTPVDIAKNGTLVHKLLKLKMNSHMPIYVGPGIESVTIKVDGQWQDVSTWNGFIFFPTDYTDKEGMLVIRFTDGYESQEIGYSLKSGRKLPLFKITGTVGVQLEDFQSFTDIGMEPKQMMYLGCPGYLNEGHEAPVISFRLTSARPVRFWCGIFSSNDNGYLVESPTNGWYFKKGDTTENPVNLIPGDWSTPVIFPAGEYFFYPETGLYETQLPVIGGQKGG